MSEPSDGDGAEDEPPAGRTAPAAGPAAPEPAPDEPAAPRSGGVPVAAEVPPTRPHSAPVVPAPAGALALAVQPTTFPDDSPLSKTARSIDHLIGRIEQAFVFGLLALVVTVAAAAALHDRIMSSHMDRWWHYIVRGGTFATAMFAAVFATQQQRHLAMDLVSRRLTPRGRLALGVALELLTIGVAFLLFRSGLHQRPFVGGSEHLDVLGIRIVDTDVVTTISIGAALIALHSVLHIVIAVDYLARGKLPPERARSGH